MEPIVATVRRGGSRGGAWRQVGNSQDMVILRGPCDWGGEIPGLCLRGEAVAAAPAGAVAGAPAGLAPLGEPGSPSSVRTLSRRASTPATACERREPHPERLPGVAICIYLCSKVGRAGGARVSHQSKSDKSEVRRAGIWTGCQGSRLGDATTN